MPAKLLAVGTGGFLGCCARYGLTRLLPAAPFPLATLAANVAAGLIIGVIVAIDAELPLPPKLKLFVTTGVLGGLSTFSTFSLETVQLFQSGKTAHAAANILLNLSLSLLGVVIGAAVAKSLIKAIKP